MLRNSNQRVNQPNTNICSENIARRYSLNVYVCIRLYVFVFFTLKNL